MSRTLSQSFKLGLAVLLLCGLSGAAHAQRGITISRASLLKTDTPSVYALNASIDYELSEEAKEALHNGVILTFNVSIKIQRPRQWMWASTLHSETLVYRLRYRTLTRIYQVINERNGSEANYSSLGSVVRALGHIESTPISAEDVTDDTAGLTASIKAALNIEALPLPMRPLAYVTPAWHHSSDWYTWPLQP